MGTIKNVVFDLGGVMINYYPRKFIEDLGYEKELGDRLCDAIFYDPTWIEMDRGTYPTYHDAVPVFVQRHPELEGEIRHFFNNTWMDIYTVKEDTEEILYNWAAQRANIYILSNYAADGFSYACSKFPFFEKAKGKVCSAFEHCMKPDPEIYRILLERYNLDPSETVFIDDVPKNVQGAIDVGIHGIVFTTPEEVRQRLVELGLPN